MNPFTLTEEKAKRYALDLVTASGKLFLGTIAEDGSPWIKAMFKVGNDGLDYIYMSTNTSSRRVAQIGKNPGCCVYFANTARFKGLMLTGIAEAVRGEELRKRFWQPGCEKYYPLGVNDPDYCIIRFRPKWGNLYMRLQNMTFALEEAAPQDAGRVFKVGEASR